jgi:hypothetical protein
MKKKEFLRQISSLHPEKDHLQIIRLNAYYDFPWDNTRALEFALFRTFAVAPIGHLLHKTGEFERRTQKRYDDTDLILSEIIENGYDSERGKKALELMNNMHNSKHIPNELMLYVLSTFVIEPYKWNMRFGYRIITENEKTALHKLWYEIGLRMGITGIPVTFNEMEQLNNSYEKERFHFSPGGRKVADATINLMLGWYLPRFLWPLFRPYIVAIMDDHLRTTLNYKKPGFFVRNSLRTLMALRKLWKRMMPVRNKPMLRTTRKTRTYPDGYSLDELGASDKSS